MVNIRIVPQVRICKERCASAYLPRGQGNHAPWADPALASFPFSSNVYVHIILTRLAFAILLTLTNPSRFVHHEFPFSGLVQHEMTKMDMHFVDYFIEYRIQNSYNTFYNIFLLLLLISSIVLNWSVTV